MRSFRHINSNSVNSAVKILDENPAKSKIIAGGTDLLGTLKDKVHAIYPEVLVNIKSINDLAYIKEDQEGLKIGSMTRLHAIETNQIIKEKYPVLAEAARSVASPQIRRMGTISGNICQEPRCWYYRNPENTFHCTRKGGKYCNALTGENRYHSIFGAMRVESSPCSSGCPGHVDIPSYMNKIRENDLAGAAKILLQSNPIPAITGRVCPHFCEQNCNRGEYDESVSIRGVERFLGDYILEHAEDIMKAPPSDTDKALAVVGSGPAGLSAAYYLRMGGNKVIVFERMEEAGGMLTYGIPEYRLPKKVVRRVVEVFQGIGIEFRLGVQVGKEMTLESLRSEFDSAFIASGAWKQPSIGLEGEELTMSGLDFLHPDSMDTKEISGKKVLVIGGGNVAVDVGVTARRLGAGEITLACLESREEMPALEWEIEQAVEEGIKLMPSWGPAKVLQTDGKVTGMELVRCTSVFDEKGRFSPSLDESARERVDADLIVLAVGQKPDLSFIESVPSLENAGSLIQVQKETQKTNVDGLFAGGDAASGPATVIEAIGSGKRAAIAIQQSLNGEVLQNERAGADKGFLSFNRLYLKKTVRAEVPEHPVSERKINTEDSSGLGQSDITNEANRCFNCGCVAVNPSDIAPALIALDAKIKTTKRTIEAEEFFDVRPQKSTILNENELVTEIQIPLPAKNSGSAYSKFRIRKTIDFPIVGVASALSMKSNEVVDARIVVGAVAPIPLRLKDAENIITGKVLDEKLAEEAADVVLNFAIPMEKNGFKVPITKALIKRNILAAKDSIMKNP